MSNYATNDYRDLAERLAKGFTEDSAEDLKNILDEDCEYISEYNENSPHFHNRQEIIDHMSYVDSNVDDSTRYHYQIIDLREYPEEEFDISSVAGFPNVAPYGIRLFQFKEKALVAIVVFSVTEEGKIDHIILSRSEEFNEEIYHRVEEKDLPDDLPTTAEGWDEEDLSTDYYIWRNADSFFRKWLGENGYHYFKREFYEDCIGYRCRKGNDFYTIYMFAYGQKKTSLLDGDYCEKFLKYDLSSGSKSLVVYLQVKRYRERGRSIVRVADYSGNEHRRIELWEIGYINGEPNLLFYPAKETIDAIYKLMYAYNRFDDDVLHYIVTKHNPYFKDYGANGTAFNSGFFNHLKRIREKNGDMRIGYLSKNDVIYSRVPYIEGYGFFSIEVATADGKILGLTSYPMDGGEINIRDFILTDEKESEDLFSYVPELATVIPVKGNEKERFSLILGFDNGEQKKYVLAIDDDRINDEVISYESHAFTDRIWSTASVGQNVLPNRGIAVRFINDFFISGFKLYHDGKFYCEEGKKGKLGVNDNVWIGDMNDDVGCGHINGDGNLYFIDKIKGEALHIPERYKNTPMAVYPVYGGYDEGLIMVSLFGELDLQYHHNFHGCAGMWGWLDTEGNEVIAPQYVYALQFCNGRATVCKGDWSIDEKGRYWCYNEAWGIIDKTGKEIVPCQFDELYEIDETEKYILCHTGGWDDGYQCIYDMESNRIVTELDFDFDPGYMFNERFYQDGLIIFDEHEPGEEKDYIYVYSITENEWIVHHQLIEGRTYNGETKMVVNKDGEDIIVF
ncbi:MAG: WG repeat-containing protein [Erysipelotrichaceae bacterium]|nr:WG repeat-containing protein [Erysipelotrichaceae bacterium]